MSKESATASNALMIPKNLTYSETMIRAQPSNFASTFTFVTQKTQLSPVNIKIRLIISIGSQASMSPSWKTRRPWISLPPVRMIAFRNNRSWTGYLLQTNLGRAFQTKSSKETSGLMRAFSPPPARSLLLGERGIRRLIPVVAQIFAGWRSVTKWALESMR